MTRIFHLRGTVCDADGSRLQNVNVAVVDRDAFRDDLLGVGRTDERGEFRISFTQGEFNQEWLERETTPDIYLVLSVYPEEYVPDEEKSHWSNPDAALVAVTVMDFPGLSFPDGTEVLGDLCVAGWHERPPQLPDQNPVPGLAKETHGLQVDDDIVRHCLTEVAPRVQRLTRWPGLLDDLQVRVSEDLGDYLDTLFERYDAKPDALTARLVHGVLKRRVLALYDPLLDAIFVNTRTSRHCNLDGLKVILGHELVHVGQFRKSPRLRAQYETRTREMMELEVGDQSPAELLESLRKSDLHRHMEDIEGYAHYIQTDFLEKHYNCSMIVHHVSLFDRALAYLLQRSGFADDLQQAAQLKGDQYETGRERYRKRQKSDAPARFDHG